MLRRASNKLKGYEGDLELLLADVEYLPFKDEAFRDKYEFFKELNAEVMA